MENEIKKLKQQVTELRFKAKMGLAIAKYNSENPAKQINLETADYIFSTGLNRHQIIADKIVMLESGGDHYKDNTGFGSMENWLADEFIPDHGFVVKESEASNNPDSGFASFDSNPDHEKMINGLRSRGISGLDR